MGQPCTYVGRRAAGSCPEPRHGALAVRIEGDVILLSTDAATLTSADNGPGHVPLEVLRLLDGDALFANGYGYQCVTQNGIATSPDGSGEMVAILGGSPSDIEIRPDPGPDSGVGEPMIDDDVVMVELDLQEALAPRALQSDKFAGVFCG